VLQAQEMSCLVLLLLVATASTFYVSGFDPDLEMDQIPDEEARARQYLDYLDKEFSKWATKSSLAEWAYASNITEENLAQKVRPSGTSSVPSRVSFPHNVPTVHSRSLPSPWLQLILPTFLGLPMFCFPACLYPRRTCGALSFMQHAVA
jgi:hypothetical protein